MGLRHLQAYVRLARLAHSDGRLAWQLRPKHHLWHHVLLDGVSEKINSRFVHCFRGEAAMQFGKRHLATDLYDFALSLSTLDVIQ